jgi:hypothetical protein
VIDSIVEICINCCKSNHAVRVDEWVSEWMGEWMSERASEWEKVSSNN